MEEKDNDREIEEYLNNNIKNFVDSEMKFKLKCYSLPMYHDYEKFKSLENTDKIILPMFVLQKMKENFNDLKFPLIFNIINDSNDHLINDIGIKNSLKTQVFEFLEDTDNLFIPFRLMQTLWLEEGTEITLKYVMKDYVKGTKIKIRPHSTKFLNILNPKEFLEKGLIHNYSILSEGDIISLENRVDINEKTSSIEILYFDIVETEPEKTIIINNTDLNVEFCKPLNYIEPKKIMKPIKEEIKITESNENKKIIQEKDFIPFSGKGYRLGD